MDLSKIVDFSPKQLREFAQNVGNTPLQPLYLQINGKARKIFLKLESTNPTGSMKDRTGYALIQTLEKQGLLKMDTVVIESTSGNLGVALALQCKARQCRFLAVIDPKTTEENISKMRSLGAQIDKVQQPDASGGYLLTRLERVQEICRSSNNYIWTNQYANPANPHIHYTTTGPEIYQQMHGKVGAIFVPVSTGGTLAGIGRFFRETNPSTQIIGVDAYGSVIFGTAPASRKLTGIGSSKPSSFISPDLFDTYQIVQDVDAFAYCRALHAKTSIKVGGSSGAVLAACTQYLSCHPEIDDVVCVCADKGENYLSSIFNDEWIQEQKIDLAHRQVEEMQAIAFETLIM